MKSAGDYSRFAGGETQPDKLVFDNGGVMESERVVTVQSGSNHFFFDI
ncbi:MAG: hypothetical protein PHI18_08360 [bacterium]|nr:hypothetical protein [bacterium]